ncbi:unnamed protein product [Rotaria sordida]|uniref:Uncharacterized protein n=1 Tax=Rotaria sordida TaxID=392033 RepID=A0A814SJW6_9BILA|nr:unnamed protein product [Rotaria sordida]CAF3909905.1 unnamed protein product [Rotaria sordida]
MKPEYDLIEVHRRVWLMQVQSLMLTKKAKSTTTTETNQDDQQATCEKLLRERSEEMNLEIDLSERELIQKNSLVEFTSIMDEAIQIYVQEYGIKPLEMTRQLKKAIVMYNYQSEMLERKYLQETPNQYQIEVAKLLVNMRRDVEKSKRVLLKLKQGAVFNKSSISFDSIQVSMPTSNDTNIKNDKVQQQQLWNKDEKQIRCKKFDLLAIHISQAEQTYYLFQNLFDYELSKI